MAARCILIIAHPGIREVKTVKSEELSVTKVKRTCLLQMHEKYYGFAFLPSDGMHNLAWSISRSEFTMLIKNQPWIFWQWINPGFRENNAKDHGADIIHHSAD